MFYSYLNIVEVTYIYMVLHQKPPDKKPPDKSSPTISPRYKSPPPKKSKNRGWILFLGLVDPSRNLLASTAYFTIISSIILGCLLSGGF